MIGNIKKIITGIMATLIALGGGVYVAEEMRGGSDPSGLVKVWDATNKTVIIGSDTGVPEMTVKLISSEPDLCTFTEIFEVTNFKAFTPHKDKDFKARTVKQRGNKSVTAVEWFIEQNVSYTVNITDYKVVQVEKEVYNNKTGKNETILVNETVISGYHDETRYKTEWQDYKLHGKPVSEDSVQRIKVVYRKPPEVGEVRIQTIPMFRGAECDELTWWNTSWKCRRNLTINHSMVDAAMSNFPVMVSITQLGLNTAGNDTRMTDSSDNQVAREIECYNATSGALVFFFNGTSVSNTVDTSFWMYYNNSAATEPAASSTYGSQKVWDSNFKGVWHLNQDPSGGAGAMKDSTSNLNNGTSDGTMTSSDLIDAPYGKGVDLDGADDLIACDGVVADTDLTEAGLAIMELYMDKTYETNEVLTGFCTDGSWNDYYYFGFNDGAPYAKTAMRGGGGTYPGATMAADKSGLHSHTSRKDGEDLYYYVDGSQVASDTATKLTANIAVSSFDIGRMHSSTYCLKAKVYEARITSGTIRTVGYVSTTHNNLNNPTATGTAPFFASFGAEEDVLSITSYAPATPLDKSEGDSQLFNVTASENCQCRWYIDSTLVQTNATPATDHAYTNTSLALGANQNFSAVVNTSTSSDMQTWDVTVTAIGAFQQSVYKDSWQYVTNLNSTDRTFSQFFSQMSAYYLIHYNKTAQRTYGYKGSRWEKYAAYNIPSGDVAMLRYTANDTITRDNASGTFSGTLKTGLNQIGHSYNGTRNLTWYNTTIASSNVSTITCSYPINGTTKIYTYGSIANGTIDISQGFGVEINVTADTPFSGI